MISKKILTNSFMKKAFRIPFFAMVLVIVFSLAGHAADVPANFSGGRGTKSDPYRIANARDLTALAKRVQAEGGKAGTLTYRSAYYLQTADIDLSSIPSWTPIGIGLDSAFTGVYDGGERTISNIQYNEKAAGESVYFQAYGLFGIVSGDVKKEESAVIRNIYMQDAFSQMRYEKSRPPASFGTVVGCVLDGRVENCMSNGRSMTIEDYSDAPVKYVGGKKNSGMATYHLGINDIGGIVGAIYNGYIENCLHDRAIAFYSKKHGAWIGGITGVAAAGIKNSVNRGKISIHGPGGEIGGIASTIWGESKFGSKFGFEEKWLNIVLRHYSVEYCVNYGDIELNASREPVAGGGIAARVEKGVLSHCVNKGSLYMCTQGQEAKVGGLVGMINAFWSGRAWLKESSNEGDIWAVVRFDGRGKEQSYIGYGGRKIELFSYLSCGGAVGMIVEGSVENVVNTGNVKGYLSVKDFPSRLQMGGIVGGKGLYRKEEVSLRKTLNVGDVGEIGETASDTHRDIGEIIGGGRSAYVSIEACYWRAEGKGPWRWPWSDSNSVCGGALSSEELKKPEYFRGWDFEKIWVMSKKEPIMPVLRFVKGE